VFNKIEEKPVDMRVDPPPPTRRELSKINIAFNFNLTLLHHHRRHHHPNFE
jgi:hypothetical protein